MQPDFRIAMTFSKLYDSYAAAVADVPDGATVLVGGLSRESEPTGLLRALVDQGAHDLTIVCDTGLWDGGEAILSLLASGRVSRLVAPAPLAGGPGDKVQGFPGVPEVETELIPQSILAERLRAAGAGIGGFFVAAGSDARYPAGKEKRTINGVECVLESPLHADFALLRACTADHLGNLAYAGSQRGWNATMATAARITVVEADNVGEPGIIHPELVVTPGIYVNRIVEAARTTW